MLLVRFLLILFTSLSLFAIGCTGGTPYNGPPQNEEPAPDPDPEPDPQPENLNCPPMEAPTGEVYNYTPADVADLQGAVALAPQNSTILLADGTYNLNGSWLWILVPGLTVRSESGDPEAVIIDGNYVTNEIFTVAASNVTIAEITIQNAGTHPIHVISGDDTEIYRVNIIDPGEQGIKINPDDGSYPDNGLIACSNITLTDAGRSEVENCYTGGIDAHQAYSWTVRDNYIEGFWCENGLSEHAIHFWRGSRDTIVERNTLVNNARGIGFGLDDSGAARTYFDDPCPSATYVGHYDGVIRNNSIVVNRAELLASESSADCGICLWSACGAQALHNTIVSTGDMFSSIEWRYEGSQDIFVTNNLATHNTMQRNDALASLSGNITDADLSLFVNVEGGDLHLTSGATVAINEGVAVADGLCDDDIDGDDRDETPDVGADEYVE